MHIQTYLDSTYLKTPEQAGITEAETLDKVRALTQEAIDHSFFAVMIRPDYVKTIKEMITQKSAEVVLGTVIGFPEGTYSIEHKLQEAQKAIDDGADELDFVINYTAYQNGNIEDVQKEFLDCTKLCIDHGKVAKWIIEIAALTDEQIGDITKKISEWAQQYFSENDWKNIFVKSSTGFYQTEGGKPNGATVEGIKIMLANAGPLPVKAAGGIKNPQEAAFMIDLGIKRIGTSSAKSLIQGDEVVGGY